MDIAPCSYWNTDRNIRGPGYLDFGILNPLILKIMPGKQYQTTTAKSIPAWALRFMGQNVLTMSPAKREKGLWKGEK